MKIHRLIILLPFIVLFVPLHSWGAETVPLKVILNTMDKGEHLLMMTPDGDMLFSRGQLTELGFKGVPEKAMITEGGYVSLRSLAPGVSFSLHMQESALLITAEPQLLEKYVINMGYARPASVTYTKENSAFLNYAITYSAGDSFDFNSLSIPAEMGLFISDYLFYSNVSYTKTNTESSLVRMMTNITKDDTVNIIRYTAGDFFATSGALGGSGILAGVSMTKNFSLNPYFVKYQGLNLSGLIQTPSEVDLYINNVSMKKEKLPPGAFDFSNFYGQTGAGNATLVIKDAFGREQTIVTPFYLSSNLLKAGLHDYSYNLGFKRLNFGTKSFDYTEPGFLGYHRYGFSDTFTGGLRGEVNKDLINFGPLATFLIGRAGEFDTGIAVSKIRDGSYGYSAFLSYTYNSGILSGNAAFRYASRDYTNFSLEEASSRPHFEGRIGLGFHTELLGSISANVQFLSQYGEADIKRVNLFYSRTLGNNVSLSVSASRTDELTTTYQVFASLIFTLGKNHFGTLNYQSDDSQKTLSASIEKNPPRGPGWGYKFQVETKDNEQWEPGGLSYLQYNGPYGIYSATARRTSGANSYDVSMSGGIGFIDRSFYVSRPITDSFALVKVGDIEGAKVYYSNEEVALTNAHGKAIVPGLISYNDNKISYEAADIPVNYELKELEKYISPAYRSGSVIKFDITKIQSFEGRLFLVTKSKKIAAESAVLEVNIEGKIVEAVIGKRGEFYMENLKPGKFPAKMTLEDKQCNFEMIVPESEEITVTMGDIICEMD